ncbi:MAG TPA: GGDEF domain-containing protein [Candidatus Limnocylindrales bacterium]|nr:GGDEF domain-containing protein [Candidatus Limnocylindrales bacterium]
MQQRIEPDPPADPQDRRIRRTWLLFAASFALFATVLGALRIADGIDAWDVVLAALLGVVGVAAGRLWVAVRDREGGRRAEVEGFARILHGLSRSVAPDAIVGAIARELGEVAGADHVVVVRRPPDSAFVEATLVSMRSGVGDVTTVLTGVDLDEELDWSVIRDDGAIRDDRRRDRRWDRRAGRPAAVPIEVEPSATAGVAGRRGVASAAPSATMSPVSDGPADPRAAALPSGERATNVHLGARVRSAFGLSSTISAPLRADGRVVGAIVLSRRGREPWSASTERLLAAAAGEASAALSRAYSFRQAQAKATTDALTRLPNRAYFDELCVLLGRRRGADDVVGILMIDLDHFKVLNDRHGHHVGDEVLRAVAGAIAAAVRDVDVPARYGGEEFVVLLRDPGPAVAAEVGERIRSAVAALDLRALRVRSVSVSVGAAVQRRPDEPIEEIVEAADKALYRAKRQGRDRVVAA